MCLLTFVVLLVVVMYNVFDVNYFIRTFFTVLSGRLYKEKCSIQDITTIYGFSTFQDCNINFNSMCLSRLVRDLDFARYHFYDRTGIYRRSKQLRMKSLQGCTFIINMEPISIYSFYKIDTKLIYWDERSLFFLEHQVITIPDGRLRSLLVSRQHAIRDHGYKHTIEVLLRDLSGAEEKPKCPGFIQEWIRSMQISSKKLRKNDDS